jgi:serine/threonine protein kinase
MAELDEAAIFNAARKIDAADKREAYLRQACGDDRETYERVATLLRTYLAERHFLESPPVEIGVQAESISITEGPGTVIGRYKLLELIGEGGFAVVYMADQTEPIRRQVALKIIKLGMDTRQVIARFEAERQALAMMDHPGIAKVYDAGATETGRPYFVMQLIRGVPITEYCDANSLTTEARLRLFLDVCHAVQHAHQKGIIHRDIKPTNVLVALHDGRPVSKVIDFGIAKATHQRLTEKTLYTSFRQIIGTPQYMSPEQAEFSDLDIDTRSDIYSLGVLLYELLTSTTPFQPGDAQQIGYDEICHTIRHIDPPTPSRRLSTLGDAAAVAAKKRQIDPASLRKQLQGDLDWIVMKALEKDRTRRYETADALALDIERYLTNEPIEARPPTTTYHLQKFASKHRAPVIAAAAILAVLILALVLAVIGLVRIDHERELANAERDRAEENLHMSQRLIGEVLAPASDRLDFVSDSQKTQQVKVDLLRQANSFYERILDQRPDDPSARMEMARLCNRLARLSFLSGDHEEAVCRRSIAILGDLVADFPNDATYRQLLAQCHDAMAQLCWADLRWKDSSKHYRAALDILEGLAEKSPKEPKYRDELVQINGRLAYAIQHSGEPGNAEKHYRKALQDRTIAGAAFRVRYANLLMSNNNFVEAKQQLEEALHMAEQQSPSSQWDSALNAFWISIVLNDCGRHSTCMAKPEEAVVFLKRSVDIGEELSQIVPHSPFQANVRGWSYYHLSEALIQSGQLGEAESMGRQSLQVWRSARGRMPLHNAALTYFRLGELQHREGRMDEARSNFGEANELLERVSRELPDEPYCQERFIVFLAHCPEEQFRDPQRAVNLATRTNTPSNGLMWRYLALSQYRAGAWQEAQESIEKSMQLRSGGDAIDWLLHAMALWHLDQRSEALHWHTRAQNAIASGQPIWYGDIGVLGFQRLMAEAATALGLAPPPLDGVPVDVDSHGL